MTIATIPISERKAGPYTASAAQTVFPFAFPVYAAADIDVWRERDGSTAQLILDMDYTVSGVTEQNGGSITLTLGAVAGDIIAIDGDLPKQRTSAYSGSGGQPFTSANLDADLNRLMVHVQELTREVARSVRRQPIDERSGSLMLPTNDGGTVLLAVNAAGALIGLHPVDIAGDQLATPFALTLLDDATPAEARATLGAEGAPDFNFQNYR